LCHFFFVYSPTYFLADGKGNNYIFIPNYFFTSFLGVSAAFYREAAVGLYALHGSLL
jgi:hypothetical protein